MKKTITIIITMLLALSSNANEFIEMLATNPILNDYGSNVTFYLSFNEDKLTPEIAQGDPKLRSKKQNVKFSKGLFGKALSSGRIQFNGEKNVDLSKPGTIVIWVSPQNWKKVIKEPYIIPFVGHRNTGYNLLLGRQGCKWGKSRIYAYAYFAGKKKNIFLPFYGQGGGHIWENGKWYMLALSWDPTNIYLTVNDGKTVSKMITAPLGLTFNFFTLQVAKGEAPKLLVDEFVVLNKQLSNEELIKIYQETIKMTIKKK